LRRRSIATFDHVRTALVHRKSSSPKPIAQERPGKSSLGGITSAPPCSYLDVGSCENSRSYWATDPPGHKSCVNSGALTSAYAGYPHEKWANLASAEYRDLIVGYVEVVEHGAAATDGPCDAACAQGGLDLVWELRERFPDLLVVMQNATSDVTRKGKTHGLAYPSLLDGVSHEEVYTAGASPGSRAEMLAWKAMGLELGGRPLWLGAEDYVGSCAAAAKPAQQSIAQRALADGLSSYVTDASASQIAPCFWADFP
jgi:cysteinyl-tRNA synthetase